MESFLRMLNAQMILLVYLAVGMYCMKVGLIDRDSKEKLVDIILRITLPCMILNSFNKPLTPEVMKQTALILVVAVSISILSFLLGKVIYNKYPQKKKSILQYCTLATMDIEKTHRAG
ncbi:AEC family transporter [Enterocloster sp.]|uniref:AEC family transporter n=1 Tax=Enterocloster sp. TaxID=2719315 RepID=UPI0039A1CE1D